MRNFLSPGNSNTFIAPVGGVENGKLVAIGGLVVVPMTDALQGEEFVGFLTGKYSFVKAAEATATVGDNAYWNSTTGEIETTDSEDNRRIGVFLKDASAEDETCEVRLDSISLGEGGDLESKVDKVDGTEGNLVVFGPSGSIADGGPVPEGGTSGSMLLVEGATEGNFANFDAAGQVVDSTFGTGSFSVTGHTHSANEINDFSSASEQEVFRGQRTYWQTAESFCFKAVSLADGDTITINSDVYELDTNSSVTEGHIAVDINGMTKAQALAAMATSFAANSPVYAGAFNDGSDDMLVLSFVSPMTTLSATIANGGGFDTTSSGDSGLSKSRNGFVRFIVNSEHLNELTYNGAVSKYLGPEGAQEWFNCTDSNNYVVIGVRCLDGNTFAGKDPGTTWATAHTQVSKSGISTVNSIRLDITLDTVALDAGDMLFIEVAALYA